MNRLRTSGPLRTALKTVVAFSLVCLVFICASDQALSFIFGELPWSDRPQLLQITLLMLTVVLSSGLLMHQRIRRQQTEAKRANERSLASIFRAAPCGIGMIRDRILLEVNDRFCLLTGYARDELIGQCSRMLYADDAAFEQIGHLHNEQRSGLSPGTVESRWLRKDGTLIDVLLSSTPIDIDHPEAGLTFTALDITDHKRIEQHLRDNEARYHAMIEMAVDGILLGDYQGIILEANHHICTMFGMGRHTLIGRHISELPFCPQSIDAAPFRFDLLRQGETVISERDFLRPDGSVISVEMRSKMMPDGTYQSIYRDITVRRQIEQALRESEEKFALSFAASPDAVNINRLDDGMYVDINTGFTELSGYTRDDVDGKTSIELNIWHDLKDRETLVQALRATGHCDNLEAVFRRKDGSLGIGLLSARVIYLGQVPHILSITRDITQKRQAAADLERLRVAIEQAGEVVVITDTLGNIQYANPAFERTSGYCFAEVHQQSTRILKSGQHDAAYYQNLWTTIASGQTWSGRMVNRKKDGSLYTEEATISPVFDQSGAIVNYVAIKRDITAQLKLEAQYLQAQKMESVGRLTGGVAHDFNNMLAVIIGFTELAMVKSTREDPAYADLERILEAAHRSADIVQQLLAFARKQAIAPKVIDLNRLVDGMLKFLRRLIGEDTELRWMPADELPTVCMDPVQVDQILANLCINARDAIDEGGIIELATGRVMVDAAFCRSHPGAQPGEYVTLVVRDNGCGMEAEVIEKIFDPFFTTKGTLGTGLGLATVYGIVSQNNGIITVESEPGKGTTFVLYLPADTGEALSCAATAINTLGFGREETILLVEDDPGVLDLGRTMLETLGYRVLTASSPSLALELMAHTETVDLLLTDVVMPEMNGAQLAKQLRELRPELRVLFMSGYTADIIAPHGVLHEDLHFLQKPFDLHTISSKVREALQAGATAQQGNGTAPQ